MIFSFKIPVRIIIIGILLFMIIVGFMSRRITEPDFLNYCIDKYGDWKIRWEWRQNHIDKKHYMSKIRPICTCGCELSERSPTLQNDRHLYCPTCGRTYLYFSHYNLIDVEKIFLHKVNTGSYRHPQTQENDENK